MNHDNTMSITTYIAKDQILKHYNKYYKILKCCKNYCKIPKYFNTYCGNTY